MAMLGHARYALVEYRIALMSNCTKLQWRLTFT